MTSKNRRVGAAVSEGAGQTEAKKSSYRDLLRALLPPAVVLGSLTAYFLWGHRVPVPAAEARTVAVPRVTTSEVLTFDESFEVVVEGVVRPYRQVPLATEVAGRVRTKSERCQEGTYVAGGELLFEIDPTDYEIAVRRFTQELAQSENALREWQVERDNVEAQAALSEEETRLASRELERIRQLVGRGAASQAALDESQRAEITARNSLLAHRNQIRMLDARYDRAVSARDLQRVHLEQAQRDLERTRIFAPCNGTIVTENVEQDGYVQAGATMIVINDTSAAEVACQLEFDDMYWLWGTRSLGAKESSTATTRYEFPRWPVTVSFPIQDLVCEWDGELIRYGGTGVDPSTRTIPCQVHVAEPQQGRLKHLDGSAEQTLISPPLTVGMFVTVRAQLRPHTSLIKLPADALRAGSVVWRVADGQLHTIPVKLARRLHNDVLVYGQPDQANSLQPGDRIVTSPLALVQDGMAVHEATAP